MKFYIQTYGCQMNVNDSEKMRTLLHKQGYTQSDTPDSADAVIINSCAVRDKAQEKIFSFIGRLPKSTKVIVAGCVAQAEREEILKRNRSIDHVMGTHQVYSIDKIVANLFGENPKRFSTGFSKEWRELVPEAVYRDSPASAYLSIMEGCDNFCSYCIVPFTRGREKVRPFKNIMEEAEYLSQTGFKEIILLGQNVNNWMDESEGMRFPDLLRSLASQIDMKWIRFITSYPGYFEDQLIEVMADHRNIARHIHFPVQSGSTRILKKMNRSYTRPQYLNMIHKFERRVPEIKFSSDFIVGFPGETERDFQLTLSIMEEVEYESVFSFIYSPRKYTKAAEMVDKLMPQEKKERLYQLQKLQEKIQLKNNKELIGRTLEVFVTAPNARVAGEMVGRTETYRVVNFKSSARIGEFRQVRIEKAGPHSLRGVELAHI